ncbi:MAG: PilZ domain-containing protein [Acidiferrobacterales bacterium]
MSASNKQERRNYARRDVEVTATVSVEGHQATLTTKDLSEGGAFLKKGDSPIPSLGTELFVEISSTGGNDEPIVTRAEVIRVTSDGFGIIFLE